MKIEVKSQTTAPVSEGFVGLVSDSDGEIWLFTNDGAIFLTAFIGEVITIEEAIQNYSPFTVFTGSLTISN